MSRARLLKALNREYADKMPHQLALNHFEFIKDATGIDYKERPLDASLKFHELYEVEIGGPGALNNDPIDSCDSKGIKSEVSPETEWFVGSPFKTAEDVLAFDVDPFGPDSTKAQMPQYALENYRWLYEEDFGGRIKKDIEEWDNIERLFPGKFTPGAGLYTTAFMWPVVIFGWDLFLEAGGLYPDETGALIRRFAQIAKRYSEYVAESNHLFASFHDDIAMASGPVFRPEWYRKYIFPLYEDIYEPLRKAGKPIIFLSDGNLGPFLEDIKKLNPDGLSFEISTDLNTAVNALGKEKIYSGNIDSRVMQFGQKEDIYKEVRRVAQVARDIPGFILFCSNCINANISLENVYHYFDAIEKYRSR